MSVLQFRQLLAGYLKRRRKWLEWSQHTAARQCQLDVAHYTRIEKAQLDIRLSTLFQVCQALGVEIRIAPISKGQGKKLRERRSKPLQQSAGRQTPETV